MEPYLLFDIAEVYQVIEYGDELSVRKEELVVSPGFGEGCLRPGDR
jgi:hypothetical protein